MPKFLVKVNYVGDGIKSVLKDGGTGRVKVVKKLAESTGGTLEAMYFAMGDVDAYIIIDGTDNISAVAASLTAGASGAVNVETVALLTPEEMDDVASKARKLAAPTFD